MTDPPPQPAGPADSLVDWLLVVIGMSLLAMMLLTPPWLEGRQLAWQRDQLQRHAQHWEHRREVYQRYLTALAERDPVVLERVAFEYLGLKPVGTQVVDGSNPGVERWAQAGSNRPAAIHQPVTFEQWLDRQAPPLLNAPAGPPQVNSMLVRMTKSSLRFAVIGAGLLSIALGLIESRRGSPPRSEAAVEASPEPRLRAEEHRETLRAAG